MSNITLYKHIHIHEQILKMTILVVSHKPGEFVETLGACVSTGKCTTAVHYISLNTVAPALLKYVKHDSLKTHFHMLEQSMKMTILVIFHKPGQFLKTLGDP